MLEPVVYTRKLRPKGASRKRPRLRPIADGASTEAFQEEAVDCEEEAMRSVLDEASSSSSCFASEVTSESGAFFAGSEQPKKLIGSVTRQRKTDKAVTGRSSEKFHRITRSYTRKKQKLRAADEEGENRGEWFVSFPDTLYAAGNSKNGHESLVKQEKSSGNAFSGLTTSEVSHVSGEFAHETLTGAARSSKESYEVPEISDSSCHESVSVAKAREFLIPSYDSQTLEPGNLGRDADLVCSEHLSNSEESPDSSSCKVLTLSELGSDILPTSSGGGYSGHSSFFFDSSDDCLERSRPNSTPSFFSLFLGLGSEFTPYSSHIASPGLGDEDAHEFTLMRFENRDYEESYQRFRSRERKQALLHDYTEYSAKTEYGDLILHQRLVMVNWMVEHANAEELQCETLFLGVGLMDRFLSRGFFKTEGNLQLVGIACITLATRLEENQPYNCVRRKSFYVGDATYSRREVVAMEWFIQGVLNFQCLHLTAYNFLWFYLKAAKADAAVEKLAKYLAVLSLLDHDRLSFWPSTVAAGLVILASLATDHDASCNWVMETHVRTRNDDLPECIQSLEWLVKYACS